MIDFAIGALTGSLVMLIALAVLGRGKEADEVSQRHYLHALDRARMRSIPWDGPEAPGSTIAVAIRGEITSQPDGSKTLSRIRILGPPAPPANWASVRETLADARAGYPGAHR